MPIYLLIIYKQVNATLINYGIIVDLLTSI